MDKAKSSPNQRPQNPRPQPERPQPGRRQDGDASDQTETETGQAAQERTPDAIPENPALRDKVRRQTSVQGEEPGEA